ncbi:MAG: tRNA uridine-5-carboxymethylaminomethyl(34) synthesis GTPase MnmE [Lactobacillus sp.]|jgi:tRNA modification GTPase|nr:tRNA uridine-5-carboxymethylaminomethyl(34) synthesis GTPase MnmE [Lactobacillus sp.]
MSKTIYALSTVFGKSGVAVIRVSGLKALSVVSQMTDLDTKSPKPRHAYFCTLSDPVSRATLDKCLLLYFQSPNSFTGEDIVELHTHGSKAVISSVVSALSKLDDYCLAEPGEFSKRAFYNGKMDLTEAEGLADLIDSETSEQQKYALLQMEGSLKNLYEGWREQMIGILSHLEAYIDFPEEDIPEAIKSNLLDSVFKLKDNIKEHLSADNIGERLRDGFRVVIVGPPNAGKSSLLNTIVKREVAIVSDIEGTTRDAIDIHLDIKGYPVIFTDTAGLREAEEEIEKKGIEITFSKITNADLVLCMFDASKDSVHIFDDLKNRLKNNVLYVANKSDKLTSEQRLGAKEANNILISAKDKDGIDNLLDALYQNIQERFTSNSSLIITRHRYRQALENTVDNLSSFNLDKEIELSAEDIRLAARELGKITGKIEIDDILDKIFGDFCIGK